MRLLRSGKGKLLSLREGAEQLDQSASFSVKLVAVVTTRVDPLDLGNLKAAHCTYRFLPIF